MKAITKSSRVNSAIQVLQCMNDGMTVVDACEEVGIPRSTYYDIIKNNPEVIAEYQEMVEANAKEQLGMILLHKNQILQKIIEDGLSDGTSPKDRLAIYKGLNELVDNLSQNLQIESQAAAEAHEFLKRGPTTRPQVSRLTATQSTIMIESET
jgi:hypothetical protein